MEEVLNFLKRNNVNLEALKEGDLENIHHILRPYNVNRLINMTSPFYEEEQTKNVSIAEILGYDKEYCDAYYFLESLPTFFNSQGSTYQQRSIGLLSLNADEIMEKLEYSFRSEPIKVHELEDNSYCISTNGLHRFTILKVNYLIEYEMSNKTEEEIASLNKKYTFPVKSKKLDYIKTYSNLILNYINNDFDLRTEYDENDRKTGRVELYQKNKKVGTLTDQELIALTSEFLSTHQALIPLLLRHVILIPSFKRYITEYHSWILDYGKEANNTLKTNF